MARLPFLPVVLLLTTSACVDRAAKLPVFDSVPAFSATASDGKPFGRSQMEGCVWIVDFIYTNCPAACPMMSARMHRLADRTRSLENVRYLSVSVDPARDHPPVLAQFASRFGGGTPRWVFLTASPETVHQLAFDTFHIGDLLGKIEHSTRFALVDRRGRIRGYYASIGDDQLDQLQTDARLLAKSRS